MNYDPNLVLCGRMATQTVRLTFGQWEYRKTMEVTVDGNLQGLSVIEAAVENALDELLKGCVEDATIILVNEKGDELLCELDEIDDDCLRDMLISAEIIDIYSKARSPSCPLKIVPETHEGELKPCPFCGGKAKNYSRYSNIGRLLHFAGCEACSAETSHREDMEQAIAAWNRRDGNA